MGRKYEEMKRELDKQRKWNSDDRHELAMMALRLADMALKEEDMDNTAKFMLIGMALNYGRLNGGQWEMTISADNADDLIKKYSYEIEREGDSINIVVKKTEPEPFFLTPINVSDGSRCPRCHRKLDAVKKACPHCGQHLRWREQDEK